MFSGTVQVSHQVCQFFCQFYNAYFLCSKVQVTICTLQWRKGRLPFIHFGRLGALRWCHRDVGRQTEETVGFPEWTAQFSMWKATKKDSSVACAIARQNYAVYSVFPSGMTSLSKIAQLNWQCLTPFRNIPYLVLQYKQVQILETGRFMHGSVHGCLFNRKNYCHFYQNGQWSRILNFFLSKSARIFTFRAWGKELIPLASRVFTYRNCVPPFWNAWF